MKVLKRITFLTIIVVAFSVVKVFAAFSCSVSMNADSTDVKPGDSITINVTINDIELSENSKGITVFDGYLNYDSSIFEEVKKGNFDAGDNRSVTYNTTNKRVYVELDNDNGLVTTDGTAMFSINMKIKDDANFASTVVSFSNVSITDNIAKTSLSSSTTLKSNGTNAEEPTATPNVISPGTATPTNTNPTSGNSGTTNSRPTVLPQTGINGVIIFIVAGALIIGSIAGYKILKSDI